MFILSLLAALALQNAPQRGVGVDSGEPGEYSNSYAKRHALVIGIDEYRDPGYPDLTYAVADARAVAKTLIESYGFAGENVLLLNNPTKQEITQGLEDWASDSKRIGTDDLLVVFYAGHGDNRRLRDGSVRAYFVPSDAERRDDESLWSTLVGMDTLEAASETIPAKHAVFLLDCCFGGWLATRGPALSKPILTGVARQVLTAGNEDQSVLDTGGDGHSVFSSALLEALDGRADADFNGIVSFGELYDYVSGSVQERTMSLGRLQTPGQATLRGHRGGSVAFHMPTAMRPATDGGTEVLAELVLRPEPGHVYRYRVSNSQMVTTKMNQATLAAGVQHEQEVSLRFLDYTVGDSLTCEFAFGRARGTANVPMFGETKFDSNDRDATYSPVVKLMIGQILQPVGKTIVLELSPRGRVLSVFGWGAIFEDTEVGDALKLQGTEMTDEWFLGIAQLYFALLPTETVDLGSHWEDQHNLFILDHEVTFRPQFRVHSLQRHSVEWNFDTRLAEPDAEAQDSTQATRSERTEGEGTNDRARRWLVDSSEVHDASLLGASVISRRDGLPLEHTIDLLIKLDAPSIFGTKAPTTAEQHLRMERRTDWEPSDGDALLFSDGNLTSQRLDEETAVVDAGPWGGVRGERWHAASYRLPSGLLGSATVEVRTAQFDPKLLLVDGRGELIARGESSDGSRVIQLCLPPGAPPEWRVVVAGPAQGNHPYVVRLVDIQPLPDDFDWDFYDGSLGLDSYFLSGRDQVEQYGGFLDSVSGAMELLQFDGGQRVRMATTRIASLIRRGLYDEALVAVTSTRSLLESLEGVNPTERLLLSNVSAELYSVIGDVPRARRAVDDALGVLDAMEAESEQWRVVMLRNLADTLVQLGDHRAALAALDRCLEELAALSESEERRLELPVRQVQAFVLALSGYTDKALEVYDRLDTLADELMGEDSELAAGFRASRSSLLVANGRPEEARDNLLKARDRFRELRGMNNPSFLQTSRALAEIERLRGNSTEAIALSREALDGLRAWFGDLHPEVVAARAALAISLHEFGEPSLAWEEIRTALEVNDVLLGSSLGQLSERERMVYVRRHRHWLDLLLTLSTDAHTKQSKRDVYLAVRRAKGRVSRGVASLRAAARNAPELATRVRELHALNADIAARLRIWKDSPELNLGDLRADRDRLEREIALLTGAQSSESLPDQQEALPEGAAFLDFLVYRSSPPEGGEAEEQLAVWLTRRGDEPPRRIELGAFAQLRPLLSAYLTQIAGSVDERAEFDTDLGAALRERLWSPIETQLRHGTPVQTLYVSPDAELNGFPFETIPLAGNQYLIERYAVIYGAPDAASSHRTIVDSEARDKARNEIDPHEAGAPSAALPPAQSLLLVGDVQYTSEGEPSPWAPLPASALEVSEIADLHRNRFGERAESLRLVRTEPSEQRLRTELPNYELVHLATHGFADVQVLTGDSGDPAIPGRRGSTRLPLEGLSLEHGDVPQALTGLVCAQPSTAEDPLSDGFLTASEVGWLDLSGVDLVVLSACSSAIGTPEPGEGMLGLRRAFLLAGANTVIASLWPIDDRATAELMTRFYKRLWQGHSKSAALRAAQLELLALERRQSPTGSPGLWGAFVLQGRP